MKNIKHVCLYLALAFILPSRLFAECLEVKNGEVAEIKAKACEEITVENENVKKYAGNFLDEANLKRAYTGALVTDEKGIRWMYSSAQPNACSQFPLEQPVKMKTYTTCCDTGRWGKCVFGGNWLGDIDGQPINAFQ